MKKTQQNPETSSPHDLRDFVIHPKLVVTRRSGAAILKQMKSGKANQALRELMRGTD
jgi:hypothetical protein